MSRWWFVGAFAAVAASLAACKATASSDGIDAAVDAAGDAAPDAPGQAPRCDPDAPFGTPVVVAGVNTAQRDVQAVLVDELTMFLTSDRAGSLDLYVATRASTVGPFSSPAPLAALNTTGMEISTVLTADGLTMYYAHAPMGQPNADLQVTTRPTATSAFPRGQPVAVLNTANDEGDPTVTGDGGLIYFASNRPGTGDYDLYVAARRGDGSFEAPRLASELNTNRYEAHPRISADGLTLYYSSMRTDGGALGGTDIWIAKRSSTLVAFDAPRRVAELNTMSDESPTWLSADGCRMYLQSNRPGGAGAQDIWEAVKGSVVP